MTPKSEVFQGDCMTFMKEVPDGYFDLAIVDPPYGIGENWKKDRYSQFYKHESSYKNAEAPGLRYFEELFRISKNQIVWGGNYFTEFLPARQSWIVWDKDKNWEECNVAEGELAWTSFNIPVRVVKMLWNGFLNVEKRSGVHPHEKPTALYRWQLSKYAQPGQTILDTHMGSQSSRIAAYDMGFDYTGYELDPDYFRDGCKRFENFKAQLKLFPV